MFPGFGAVEGVPAGTLPRAEEHHCTFTSGLQEFIVYCGSTKGKDYDSTKFGTMITAFAEPFVTHLHEEIPMLLGLDVCGEAGSSALLAILEVGEKEAAKQDKFVVPQWSWDFVIEHSKEATTGRQCRLGPDIS